MTSKKRKYGDLSAKSLPSSDASLLDDVFQAFTGKRPLAEPPATEAPEPTPEKIAAVAAQPVSRPNRSKADTGGRSEPVSEMNRSVNDTGLRLIPVSTEPVSRPNRSKPDTGISNEPVSVTNRSAELHGFLKVPHVIGDHWLAVLDDDEFKLYYRLYRLSHGFGQNTCFVGYSALGRACKMSLSKVKRVMPKLLSRGIVRVMEVVNESSEKGSLYEVSTGVAAEPVSESNRSKRDTGRKGEPNKDHDDDHDGKDNHHQSGPVEIPPEMMRVADLYSELTGNEWTKADAAAFSRVAGIDPARLADLMVTIHARALEPIGRFAYFVTGVERELSPKGEQSRAMLKKRYQALWREVAGRNVGRGDWPPSEMVADLKAAALREGLRWDDDAANEVLGL
jgi:hypothetical protein